MECYKSNKKNKKIYNKINYTKLLLVFVLSFLIFVLFFYYIGESKNFDDAIPVSISISLLLCLGSIIGDLIEERGTIFIYQDNELGYLEIHQDREGKYLRDDDFYETIDKYGVEEIYKENNLYEGIDKGIIKNVVSIKKKYNRMVVKANVEGKEWKSSGKFTISKLYVVEKEHLKKFIIPNDYDNYEKLYKKLNKLK